MGCLSILMDGLSILMDGLSIPMDGLSILMDGPLGTHAALLGAVAIPRKFHRHAISSPIPMGPYSDRPYSR